MLSLQSFLRKGVSLSQVGSILNLKDLKDLHVHVMHLREYAKFESLGSFLKKRANGSNVSADKG